MKTVSGALNKACSITNIFAGICFFSVMILVLANIIMRNIFKQPIMGTVEIVGLLIATGLGLAMANCEMLDGNIGMDFDIPWFSRKIDKAIEIVKYLISLGFWIIVDWQIFVYANTSYINGRVTSTASIPVYPFVYILGINVFCLCVVLTYKFICTINKPSEEFRKSAQDREDEVK